MSIEEDVRLRVKGKLESMKVRLWEPPYVSEDSDSHLQKLAEDYAKELNLRDDDILAALKYLQHHSIERSKANENFKETGIAVLRISVTVEINNIKNAQIEIKLDEKGSSLISKIAQKLGIEEIRIKLIHKGRVIKHDLALSEQGVKNGAQILAIVLAGTPESLKKDSDMYSIMYAARSDAEILTEHSAGGAYMQIEDQAGNALVLPKREKQALMVAMALHERGRTEMKAGNYSLALVLLLEADKHFSECNSNILTSVDNYALLNLDISWCYLCLQSITHIPEAQARLNVCERNFHNSYGPNLERLIALKGTAGNEKALFMRLHLLQGVVLYHQNKRTEAKLVLERAEQELKSLKVNETSLCTLVELGYTLPESRIALRASDGNVNAAVEFIAKQRKRRMESDKKAKEDMENRALGLCDDKKQYIKANMVKMLTDIGFSKKISVLALKKSNNNVSDAVRLIQERPECLKESDLPKSLSSESIVIDKVSIQKVVDIGYNHIMAERALKLTCNDVNAAIELLIQNDGVILDGGSDSAEASSSKANEVRMKKKAKKMSDAFQRLSQGIGRTEDDYLDLTLDQEEEYLIQYLNLLK